MMKNSSLCKYFLLFLVLVVTFSIKVYAESDFSYKLYFDNCAVITAYNGTESDIVTPSSIDGYQVKSIGEHAFDITRNDTNGNILKNVIISEVLL